MSDIEKEDLKNVGRVLLAMLIAFLICLLLSCSRKVIEVEKPVVVEHTTTTNHTDIVRDTLLMRDSVFHYINGDTVVIERWHHSQTINKWVVTDTVRDTIPKVTTIKETSIQEVNRLHWWQTMLMWMGAIGAVALALKLFLSRHK